MSLPTFVRAYQGERGSVIYETADGKKFVFSGGDPNWRNKFLQSETGIKDEKKIKDFTPTEFEKLWRAIERYEGTKKGTVTELEEKKQIDGVKKNKKGTITAYHVEGVGWISKPQAIRLTKAGEIDAVVATSRSGKLFLRTRPDDSEGNNLSQMG